MRAKDLIKYYVNYYNSNLHLSGAHYIAGITSIVLLSLIVTATQKVGTHLIKVGGTQAQEVKFTQGDTVKGYQDKSPYSFSTIPHCFLYQTKLKAPRFLGNVIRLI